jgi:hypothetical protein
MKSPYSPDFVGHDNPTSRRQMLASVGASDDSAVGVEVLDNIHQAQARSG